MDFQNGINLNGATRTIETIRGVGATPEGKISGVISGAAGLTLDNTTTGLTPGTLILSGANTYSGATTVNAGALNIQNPTALGTTAAGTTVSSGAALQIQGGIAVGAEALTLNGSGIANDGALRNISGDNSMSGAITLGSLSTIGSDAGTLTLSGDISGAFTLRKVGAGTLTLSGLPQTLLVEHSWPTGPFNLTRRAT